jgi:uncharacterized protein (TIGR03067 family)
MMRHAILFLAVGMLAGADKDNNAAKLDGTWKLVRGQQNGKPIAAETVTSATLTIEGNKHTVKIGSDVMIGTHKVNMSANPMTIDVEDTEGPYKGKTLHGIFRLQGDQFIVCFSAPGKDRPKTFIAGAGNGNMLHVWRRDRPPGRH